MNEWADYTKIKPKHGKEVLAFSEKFIHPDYNELGVRIGFLNAENFVTAVWDNNHDTYLNDEESEPQYWRYIDKSFITNQLNLFVS